MRLKATARVTGNVTIVGNFDIFPGNVLNLKEEEREAKEVGMGKAKETRVSCVCNGSQRMTRR